jgi:segregation and condensation protein A
LTLVSEQKVDIGAVPIAHIADEYLAYIGRLRELDMEVASEFIEVASTLLSIKASSLLPSNAEIQDDEDFEDLTPGEARNILVARLLAYKQYKNVAAALSSRLESEGRMHPRQAGLELAFQGLLPDYLEGVTLHNLAVICAGLASRRKVFLLEAEHITSKPLPVEERIDMIFARLAKEKALTFQDLIDDPSDTVMVVVSFLAVLELYHRGMVDLEQAEQFGAIELSWRSPDDWAPAMTPDFEGELGDDAVIRYVESLESEGAMHG